MPPRMPARMPASPSVPAAAPAVPRPAHLARLPDLTRRVVATGGRSVTVRSPFDLQPIGDLPISTPDDVSTAAERARRVQEDWAQRPFRERAAILLRFHDRLLDRQAEVLDLIQLEAGKARAHAFEEVFDAALVTRYYARQAEPLLAPRARHGLVPGATQAWEYRHPKGLVAIVAPWNYPLSMGITDALPALMAGNAVLEKPDSQGPFSTLWAIDLLVECGLPEGLWQVVCGDGPTLGPALMAAADYFQFTGSTATGRLIAQQAGERLIGCSLELGGKNPMLVLADADLAAAVDGAVRGSFASAGQLCVSTERIYVHRTLFDDFARGFAAATARLRLGVGLDWTYDIGSLTSERQLAAVRAHVDAALAGGAEALCGGRHRPEIGPLVFEPTVLQGVRPGMAPFADETFGPVVSLYPFDSNHEAVGLANASRYGLNASIWTRDTELGRRMATRVRCGTVTVNETYAVGYGSVDAPMGGFGDSGIGRRHGAEGILKYTEPQTVAVHRGPAIASPRGVPAEAFARAASGALRALRRLPGRH